MHIQFNRLTHIYTQSYNHNRTPSPMPPPLTAAPHRRPRAPIAAAQVSIPRGEGLAGRVSEHVRALEAEVEVLAGLRHDNIVVSVGGWMDGWMDVRRDDGWMDGHLRSDRMSSFLFYCCAQRAN